MYLNTKAAKLLALVAHLAHSAVLSHSVIAIALVGSGHSRNISRKKFDFTALVRVQECQAEGIEYYI